MTAVFKRDLHLLLELVKKDLKVRYKGSLIGYLWALLQPLLQACMLYFAFRIIMRFQVENYLVFLISVLFPWQFFANSVANSSFIFLNNASIIKKVPLSKTLLLLAMIISDMLHLLIAVPVILLFMGLHGMGCSPALLYGVPLLLAVTGLLILGIIYFTSILNVFFRDTANIVLVTVQLLFYVTPIIYPLSIVPEEYLYLFRLNPLAPLFTCWRSIFMNGSLPPGEFLHSLLLSGCVFAGGLVFYHFTKDKVIEAI